MLEQFIFGAGTDTPDAQTLQRRREMVSRLQERSTATTPRTFGEGLTAIGQALAGRIHDRRLSQQEAAERERVGGEFAAITQQLLGGGGGSPFAAPVAGDVGGVGAVPAMGGGGGAPSAPSATPAPASGNAPWLRMNNTGTRNLPLSEQLVSALSFLPEMGIEMEVFSGGQPEIGSGQPRVGSVRHDHGNAADVFFTRNGERLNWANPDHVPVFQEIVRRGRAAGLTGFGAGPGYMPEGSMHIGFGNPAVWGAGGAGANAPSWLVEAFNADPIGTMDAMAASGPTPSAAQSAPMPAIGQPMQAPMQPGAALPPQQPMQPRMAAPAGNLGMIQQLAQIAANPYLGEGQRMVAQALIQQQMQGMDPMRRIQMERAQLELERLRNPTPAPVQPDWVVIDGQLVDRNAPGGPAVVPVQGFTPPVGGGSGGATFGLQPVWGQDANGNPVMLQLNNQGGVMRVDLPEGVQVSPGGVQRIDLGTSWGILDRDGMVIQTIPKTQINAAGEFVAPAPGSDPTDPANLRGGVVAGSEAARRREEAETGAETAAARRMDTIVATTRIVTTATDNALSALDAGGGGLLGAVTGMIPTTQSAEIYRQVETMQAQARIGNLQAMREASPTGGALGGVSDAEGRMLAAASGALDPRSPTFERDILNYTRSLLGVVHGAQAGDELFFQLYGPRAAEQGIMPNASDAMSGTITPATIGAMGREGLLQVDVMSLDSAAFDAYERRWNELRGGGQ
jgi:hypothetical protein